MRKEETCTKAIQDMNQEKNGLNSLFVFSYKQKIIFVKSQLINTIKDRAHQAILLLFDKQHPSSPGSCANSVLLLSVTASRAPDAKSRRDPRGQHDSNPILLCTISIEHQTRAPLAGGVSLALVIDVRKHCLSN